MSFFDNQLVINPINRNHQYLPLYQWSSLVGTHYLEAQQIIQREAPWAIIYTVVNDDTSVRTNHRSEGANGVSFRDSQSPTGYCVSDNTNMDCCKISPLKTPDCFKLNYKELGLDDTPNFNRICIFYDRQTGLVNHIPVRG